MGENDGTRVWVDGSVAPSRRVGQRGPRLPPPGSARTISTAPTIGDPSMRPPCRHPAAHDPSRREFLALSAVCGAALLLPGAAQAGKLHESSGEVTINGRLASRANEVRALDVIRTGPSG